MATPWKSESCHIEEQTMERADRNKINQNIDQLVRLVDMKKLWPKLLAHKIFSEDYPEISEWKNNLDDRKVIEHILLEIKTRGPRAYEKLIYSLEKTNQHHCVKILTNNSVEPNSSQVEESSTIQVKKSRKFYNQNSNKNEIGTYRMSSKPRGLVLIISLIKYTSSIAIREAAEHDEKNLKDLFEQMDFEVRIEQNITAKEIRQKTKEFSQDSKLQFVDSAFIIVCGHGNVNLTGDDSVVYGTDYYDGSNLVVSCNDIIEYFVSEKCQYLKNKPKTFIFQLCRGSNHQSTVYDGTNKNNPFRFNLGIGKPHYDYSDMFIAHSTLADCVAYRDCDKGSWFIQFCCEIFAEYACDHHVEDLFTMVDQCMRKKKTKQDGSPYFTCQTSSLKNSIFKNCFINPGLFEDDI